MTLSLLLTEAIAEFKYLKQPLFSAFLDASKAFDVVWHNFMLRKLYLYGLCTGNSLVTDEGLVRRYGISGTMGGETFQALQGISRSTSGAGLGLLRLIRCS